MSLDLEADVFPHLGQGSGGRPVAGKPHAGKYRELTLLRQRGGRGLPSPLPSCDLTIELPYITVDFQEKGEFDD